MKYVSPYQQLYLERCAIVDDTPKPVFWQPQAVPRDSFCLYGDQNLPVQPDWNCDRVINKLLALGLELELEVGEFVKSAQSKSDIPDDPFVKKLLQSNIADEAKHFKAFDYARKSYNVDLENVREASNLRELWQFLTNKEHPLLIAMALEIGVFLPFLGCSRLFGGKAIATMAKRIAEDEYRHIITNRTLLDDIGIDAWNLPKSILSAIRQTIAWAIDDLNIPESMVDEDFNLDFVLRASQELIETGQAQDLDDVCFVADHILPFEVSNASQYDRVLV